MIDVQIAGGDQGLAELISSTLHGQAPEASSSVAAAGKFVRDQQEELETRRPSREEIQTINFALIEDELDWTDV